MQIICKKCNSTRFKTTPSGPHIRADCEDCGAYIQFIKQEDPIMPIGRYSGMRFSEVPMDWMKWASKKIDGKVGDRIREFLNGK